MKEAALEAVKVDENVAMWTIICRTTVHKQKIPWGSTAALCIMINSKVKPFVLYIKIHQGPLPLHRRFPGSQFK